MMYKKIFIGLVVVLILSGAIKGIGLIGDYYKQFPSDIVKIQIDKESFKNSDDTYPRTVKVNYHLPIDSPLISDDVVYAFKGSNREYWKITILKKTDEGYIVEYGNKNYKNYLIEDIENFGFNGYMEPTEFNGSFDVTFYNWSGMEDFFDELDVNEEWRGVFLHMKEREEENE